VAEDSLLESGYLIQRLLTAIVQAWKRKNWMIIALAQDEGCALIAEELEAGRYRGFFTTNQNLANRCMRVLKSLLPIQEVDI
jgi:hypothetical protein